MGAFGLSIFISLILVDHRDKAFVPPDAYPPAHLWLCEEARTELFKRCILIKGSVFWETPSEWKRSDSIAG